MRSAQKLSSSLYENALEGAYSVPVLAIAVPLYGPFEVGTKCEIQRDKFEGQKLKTVSKDKIKSAKLQANINIKVQFVVAEQETIHQFTVSKIICKHSIL